MSGIYLPDELWKLIKLFIFHDIKYGKHLKNDKYIIKYNNIIKKLPKKNIPDFGPRILFSPINTSFRNYKYIYFIPLKKNKKYFIFEIMPLHHNYIFAFKKYDQEIFSNYYKLLEP